MRRRAWLVVPAAAAALALPAASSAHAFLVRSIPTAGSAVVAPPRSVVLDFDEPVSPAHIDVTRTDGTSVRAGKPYVPKGRPTVIVVPLRPNLPHGGYVVHWSEVDEDDGHVVSGVFSFAIGADQTAPAVSASGGSDFRPRDTVARWLLLAGLLVAAGIAVFRRFVWPVRHGAVASAVALALAAGGAVLLLLQQPGLLTTRFDKLTLAGAVGAAAASLVALASLRLRGLLVVADVAAVLLLALPTLDGHAVARGPSHLLSVPSDLVHLLSASVWIGGLFSLLVLVRPADRAAATRRFAPFALAAVGALALTGVLRAIGELRSVSQLWSTSYGNAILVKTVLFATVIAIAAAAHRRPRRQALLAEGAILFVLLGAVAVLVGLRPGRDVQTVAHARIACVRHRGARWHVRSGGRARAGPGWDSRPGDRPWAGRPVAGAGGDDRRLWSRRARGELRRRLLPDGRAGGAADIARRSACTRVALHRSGDLPRAAALAGAVSGPDRRAGNAGLSRAAQRDVRLSPCVEPEQLDHHALEDRGPEQARRDRAGKRRGRGHHREQALGPGLCERSLGRIQCDPASPAVLTLAGDGSQRTLRR